MMILIRNQQRHRPLNKARIQRTARTILSLLDQSTAELSIFFVGNRKMKQLNADYRGINKVTDVLSFETALPVQHDGGAILGDVVINIPRAESQAKEYGTTFYEELFRLLIHGTLHLLGYDHEESYYRARKMRNKEEELLSKCL
ncbi:MAG: hypothetical protein AMK70_09415 [Nitrospira bacterium SG8_35_1]|nr:MAG: hypothetical protein AMK70_09415 [Nitrospira bacterium SG8_35_1]